MFDFMICDLQTDIWKKVEPKLDDSSHEGPGWKSNGYGKNDGK